MADSIDRVFGHALNTVNKIRPGSNKPPSEDRLALYGLYKQSMEGDVSLIADRPTPNTSPEIPPETLQKEQEKWDAWKANEGLSRTEAKRRYIEKLIETMHRYASNTPEARELVEELEFVWDQVKSNSHHASSGSEHSSPLRTTERGGYIQHARSSSIPGMTSSAAALDRGGGGGGNGLLRVLSPVSQVDEEEMLEEDELEEEEFVDAPVSQVDYAEMQDVSRAEDDAGGGARVPQLGREDKRWRRRIEGNLMKLTTEVTALREQLESSRFFRARSRNSFLGWVWRITWWATQLFVADAVILWVVILYLRRKKDRRLEGAIRVLLGDAVAQVQKVGGQVKMPTLPKIGGAKKQT